MNKYNLLILTVILASISVAGCYHAKITTGERSSSEIYENKWAASWIGGLVPPEVVNVEKECTAGVAMVETKHSFLNMLVGGLTAGIFTPMHITVTCAEGTSASVRSHDGKNTVTIPPNTPPQDFRLAFQQAANRSSEFGNPVYVKF